MLIHTRYYLLPCDVSDIDNIKFVGDLDNAISWIRSIERETGKPLLDTFDADDIVPMLIRRYEREIKKAGSVGPFAIGNGFDGAGYVGFILYPYGATIPGVFGFYGRYMNTLFNPTEELSVKQFDLNTASESE